jgi:hypothetical protein
LTAKPSAPPSTRFATTRANADRIDAAYGPGAAAARIAAWERRVAEIKEELK